MEHIKVLFVDDDERNSRAVRAGLQDRVTQVDIAASYDEALARLGRETYDVVITDLRIASADDGNDGLALIRKIKELQPLAEIILQAGIGAVENAVAAMRAGAFDFVEKPCMIERALENRARRQELTTLRQQAAWEFSFDNVIGDSPTMRGLKDTMTRLAESELPALIVGESGVGKELFAKAVHFHSPRRKRPILALNCDAIPQHLIESALFGCLKGPFTTALGSQPGLFEQADGGTIILDEISAMPLEAQAKLMRVLQELEILPIGAGAPRKINVRVIATTNRDLSEMVIAKEFRDDLYYRLNAAPLVIPSLRDRREDIPTLAERFARAASANSPRLSRGSLEKLVAHDWPGNMRELENTLRRACALARGGEISAEDIFFVSAPVSMSSVGMTRSFGADSGTPTPDFMMSTGGGDLSGSLEVTFRNRIVKSLRDNNWNFTQTAHELGIGRTTLWRKVKKYNLRRELIAQ